MAMPVDPLGGYRGCCEVFGLEVDIWSSRREAGVRGAVRASQGVSEFDAES